MMDQIIETCRIPELIAERCVHSQLETASCQACVDVCPESAWQLDDEQLGFCTTACAECGLCSASCPEQAILHQHPPHKVKWKGYLIAMSACQGGRPQADLKKHGRVGCIHAFSEQDLLKLYQDGFRWLLVSTGNCKKCTPNNHDKLDTRVKRVNTWLNARGYELFNFQHVQHAVWCDISDSGEQLWQQTTTDTIDEGEILGRRQFLKRSVVELIDKKPLSSTGSDTSSALPSIGQLLPVAIKRNMLPFVPAFDAESCIACDACIKVCPHQALIKNKVGKNIVSIIQYQIQPQNCSHCGLCLDVCEHDSIHIQRNIEPKQLKWPLHRARCNACGVTFHEMHEPDSTRYPLCHICSKKNHHTQLFQVLP